MLQFEKCLSLNVSSVILKCFLSLLFQINLCIRRDGVCTQTPEENVGCAALLLNALFLAAPGTRLAASKAQSSKQHSVTVALVLVSSGLPNKHFYPVSYFSFQGSIFLFLSLTSFCKIATLGLSFMSCLILTIDTYKFLLSFVIFKVMS